ISLCVLASHPLFPLLSSPTKKTAQAIRSVAVIYVHRKSLFAAGTTTALFVYYSPEIDFGYSVARFDLDPTMAMLRSTSALIGILFLACLAITLASILPIRKLGHSFCPLSTNGFPIHQK